MLYKCKYPQIVYCSHNNKTNLNYHHFTYSFLILANSLAHQQHQSLFTESPESEKLPLPLIGDAFFELSNCHFGIVGTEGN